MVWFSGPGQWRWPAAILLQLKMASHLVPDQNGQPFYSRSRGPAMLLYHFNWVFSHASQRPVNWKLAGRHHASQRSVNTWKFGHGREKNGKFLWKYLFPWKIPLLTFKLVNSSKHSEIRSNFFETDAFEKKFAQENKHLDEPSHIMQTCELGPKCSQSITHHTQWTLGWNGTVFQIKMASHLSQWWTPEYNVMLQVLY